MSRRGLDRDSRSRHRKKVSLDGRENLDSFKKLVSTIEISRSRLRNLDFVSTRPKSPKSLDRDQEICQDMTFLGNLDSFSRSRSRVSQCYHSSRSRFLNLSRFLSLKSWKSLDYVEKSRKFSINLKSLESLDLSRFVSTILICLDNLDKYLDKDKSRPKNLDFKNLDREKKKVDLDVMEILDGFQKLVSTRRTILISIGLDCRDPQGYIKDVYILIFFSQIQISETCLIILLYLFRSDESRSTSHGTLSKKQWS